jgi:hypothetical protein
LPPRSDNPEAVRKRRQRARQRQPQHRKLGRKPWLADVGDDVFSTLEYLKWLAPADMHDREVIRAALTRALSDWAALKNPFLM